MAPDSAPVFHWLLLGRDKFDVHLLLLMPTASSSSQHHSVDPSGIFLKDLKWGGFVRSSAIKFTYHLHKQLQLTFLHLPEAEFQPSVGSAISFLLT